MIPYHLRIATNVDYNYKGSEKARTDGSKADEG